MINIEDRDFFDFLYEGWKKTTGAEDQFWMMEERESRPSFISPGEVLYDIVAVDKDQSKSDVGQFYSEEDAAFVTAVHGCFGDLIRRLRSALDQADDLDMRVDDQEQLLLELCVEAEEVSAKLLHTTGLLRTTEEHLQKAETQITNLTECIAARDTQISTYLDHIESQRARLNSIGEYNQLDSSEANKEIIQLTDQIDLLKREVRSLESELLDCYQERMLEEWERSDGTSNLG